MSKLIDRVFCVLFYTISPMILGVLIYLLFAEVIPRNVWYLWGYWVMLTLWHGCITVLSTIDHIKRA